ncbi:uncharacterized protein LOC117112110 [Anneissia japonica]|uniref:uncharacterized protein LOC117112110 n=1 Tax=Anneissia japonica TaxID=1529436 RepID=UPI0014257FA9|nr:uncharacterized protein LOC117112110 [Anneissia japonica]XP_033111052.1 uncharacterized protein LOC117112110 [Anneissia japonica]
MVDARNDKPLLPLVILVCGVIGGLALVITLIFCCKYCIGKNRKFCRWRHQRSPYQLPGGMSVELPLTGEKHHFTPIRDESQVPLKPESENYDSGEDEHQTSHRSSCVLKMEPLLDFPDKSQMSDLSIPLERGQTSNGNTVCVEDSPGTHIKNSSQKPSAKLRKTPNYQRRYTDDNCDNRDGSPNFNNQYSSRARSLDIEHLARLNDLKEWSEEHVSPECKPRPTLKVQQAITRTPSPCESPHMSEVAVQFHKDIEGRSHPYDDKLDSAEPYINRDVYLHDERELSQTQSFQTPWVSSPRSAHSPKPKPTLQHIRPLSAEYYIDSKNKGFGRGFHLPEIEVEDQTLSRIEKQQDYRELWKLRATFELEESTSNSSEPDTVITAIQETENINPEYEISTMKRRYHSMDESKDRLLVQQKHKLHARTKDDSFDLAFSSISTEESDTSDRSKGQSGDSSGREGGRNLRQMQGDSGYASIEQKCMSEQKRYLYAMSDKESTSIESYVPSLSSESSPIREYPSLVRDASTEVEDDVDKYFTRKRGDSRTASKKRRQFTSGKGEAIDDSFSFPEDESEADSQSASTFFDSASDASVNLGSDSQSESSSVRRKFGRLGRLFRSHRDDRFQYYFKRDYSIDEKTDKIFKEFLRQDSMFDTPATYKSRRNRRLRISRKQHSDSLLDTPRKILEVPDPTDLRSASEDYTVEFWTRKSGPSMSSSRSRMSSRKFVLQQDSIEEEFLREERKRILDDDPLPVETITQVVRAPVAWDTIPEWRSSEPERLDVEVKKDRITKSEEIRLNIDDAVEGNRCSAFTPVGKRSPQLPRADIRNSPSRTKQSVIEPPHSKQCGLDTACISPQMDEIFFSGNHFVGGGIGRGRGEMKRNIYSDNSRVMSIPVLLAPDDDQPKNQTPMLSRPSPRHSPRLSSQSRSHTIDSTSPTIRHFHKFSCSPTLTIELAEDNTPADVYTSDKKRSSSFEEHKISYRENKSGRNRDYEFESPVGMSFLDVPCQRERPHSASSLTRLRDESHSPILERRHSTEFTMDEDKSGQARKDFNYRTNKSNRHEFHTKRISSENSISVKSRSSGDIKRASGRTQSALDVFAAQEPYFDRRDRPLRFHANRELRYSKQPPASGTSRRSDINRGRGTGRDLSPSEPYHGFD